MITNDQLSIEKHLESVSDTADVAANLAKILRTGDLLLFTGEIGAGKTTFIQALAKNLGITEPVTSPTFVLHTLYESGRILLSHVDLYRLSLNAEVESIGFEDYLDTAVTVVEWADRYSNFESPNLVLHFEYGSSQNYRILTITPSGWYWKARLSTLTW